MVKTTEKQVAFVPTPLAAFCMEDMVEPLANNNKTTLICNALIFYHKANEEILKQLKSKKEIIKHE